MTSGITAALIVAAVLGVSFRTTRHLGISATAALCVIYPWLAFVVLVIAAAVFLRRAKGS
jgi:hypothetical protein